MAEQQICTFFLNGIYFGIDVKHIQEVIRPQAMTRVPLASADICGLINLRGQIITVIDLQRRLEMSEPERGREPLSGRGGEESASLMLHQFSSKLVNEPQGFNIIICCDDEIVSLLVDRVGDVLEFPQHTFQPPPATLKGRMRQMLAGAYQLQNGFLLILDTEKILNITPSILRSVW